jgi:hypothetical protein
VDHWASFSDWDRAGQRTRSKVFYPPVYFGVGGFGRDPTRLYGEELGANIPEDSLGIIKGKQEMGLKQA